jgi:hypothetical protein
VTPQPDTPYYYYGDNCLIWKAMIFGDQAELVESFPGSYFIDEKTCSFYHHSSNLSGNICGFEGNCWEKCCSLNTGDVQGNLVGDVQGNLVGDVIGDICGNVKGDVIGNFFGNVIGGSYGNINVYSNLEFNCLNEINNIKCKFEKFTTINCESKSS